MEERVNADGCPTEVLVEFKTDDNFVPLYKNEFKTPLDGHKLKIYLKSKDNIKSVINAKEKNSTNSNFKNSCLNEDSLNDDSPLISIRKNQSVKKLSLKTLSPHSMCHISKEASNVIHNLNSSVIFDDNVLLNEEILPIPINFGNFDLDDIDEDLSDENICEKYISNQKSVTVQTEEVLLNIEVVNKDNTVNIPIHHAEIKKISLNDGVINKDAIVNVPINPVQSQHSVIKDNKICTPPIQSDLSTYLPDIEKLNESEEISIEFSSIEINSDSLVHSEFSMSKEGADDVFIIKHNSYEDKENFEEMEKEKINPKENMKMSKIMQKNSYVFKMKKGSRETLKNLSNIDQEISKMDLVKASLKTDKIIATSQSKTSIKSKSLMFQLPSSGKSQLKKTESAMETRNGSKLISRSYSFQSKRELNSSMQKPSSMYNTSFSKSFDIKQQNALAKTKNSLATPSKRYSICTPLKSAVPKPLLTPPLPSHQNLLIPRYTPQLNGKSQLSFSKSWQHSSGSFPCSNSKVLRPQNQYSSATSKKPDLSLMKLNSAEQKKQSFHKIQTPHFKVPEKNAFSTSSKRRFYSKLSLPSPLPASQNKHLARALFPSMS